jgi:hypothetical protein
MKSSPNYKTNLKKQTSFTDEELSQFDEIEQVAIAKFIGDLSELESALGMFIIGKQYGWKVIHLIHSKATVKKYEQILGIKVREAFPEQGPSAVRNNGFRLVQSVSNFWKAASGELIKLPNKQIVEK